MPNHVQAAAEGLPKLQRFVPEEMPTRYALLVDGDCLDPVYKRGDALQFDRSERIRPDDYVILFWRHDAVAEGEHQVTVKKLVVSTVNQSFWEPGWVNDSGLKPVVIVETLNPPARFAIDPKQLLGMHKCTGLNGKSERAPELRAAASASMPGVTRRNFLAKTAAASTVAATAVLPAIAEAAPAEEYAVDRLNRAAWEVAHALDDWIADMGDGPRSWSAQIFPASSSDYAVCFKNEAASKSFEKYGTLHMTRAIDKHKEAFATHCQRAKEADPVALGHEPSKAALKRLRKADRQEDEALMEVCQFNAMAFADRVAKANYLLAHERGNPMDRRHIAAILYAAI